MFPHARQNFIHPLIKGFDDVVDIPVSRYTKIDEDALSQKQYLDVLLSSDISGSALVVHDKSNTVFMFNHLEYDRETLGDEYKRDVSRGLGTDIPLNYFNNNNPDETPNMNWRAHRNLLFLNWINIIYQNAPFDLKSLGDVA